MSDFITSWWGSNHHLIILMGLFVKEIIGKSGFILGTGIEWELCNWNNYTSTSFCKDILLSMKQWKTYSLWLRFMKTLTRISSIYLLISDMLKKMFEIIEYERLPYCITVWGGLLLLLLLLSRFSHVRLCAIPETAATRLPHPWDSPGKNTGVGCHFLLQCMKVKVKSLSRVRLLATPWTAAYQAPPSMGFSRQEYWSRVALHSPWGVLVSSIIQQQHLCFNIKSILMGLKLFHINS